MNDNAKEWQVTFVVVVLAIILGIVLVLLAFEIAHFNELKSACVEQKK